MTTQATTLDLSAILKSYLDAWRAHDPDAIAALHTLDSQWQAHGLRDAVHGREVLREAFAQVFVRYPGFDFEVHRALFGEGHWVLDWTLIFQPPGQERRRIHCLDVVEVDVDGLVARKDTFYDFAQLKAAFGGGA